MKFSILPLCKLRKSFLHGFIFSFFYYSLLMCVIYRLFSHPLFAVHFPRWYKCLHHIPLITQFLSIFCSVYELHLYFVIILVMIWRLRTPWGTQRFQNESFPFFFLFFSFFLFFKRNLGTIVHQSATLDGMEHHLLFLYQYAVIQKSGAIVVVQRMYPHVSPCIF